MDRDELVEQLTSVSAGKVDDAALLKALKTRQLIVFVKRTSYRVGRGAGWAAQRRKLAADLTKEMLDSGEWATTAFKAYNFESEGQEPGGGHLHALMRVRAEFRQILLEMGFDEMPTNRWVESSFWNFDALFQPQSHPARDAHDTFFLTTPSTTATVPEDYLAAVKAMHENGGAGSMGYRYAWKRSEAEKNLLRTHTTAISARMLYALANQPGGFKPARYFSIDRVFRNEALDATHLAEFHQVEGVVADYDLTLGDLLGIIAEFFRRIGITQLRFKPAYNPYTEPSMEVFGYHPDLKKWTEIGECPPGLPFFAAQRLTLSLVIRRQLGHFPAGDARADGPPGKRARHRVGPVPGAADDDQVPLQEHSGAVWAQVQARDEQERAHLPLLSGDPKTCRP